MFENSSDLLSQVSAIIQKNSSNEKGENVDLSFFKDVIENSDASSGKPGLLFFKRPQLRKLEERIEKLENLNDHLACVIYFLLEKISHIKLEPTKTNGTNIPANHPEIDIQKDHSEILENGPKPELTKREMDVFNLLEKGLCAKEIAKVLFISETTVITHKRNLKEKFNARNTVELISKVLSKPE
jgi:DNA-binding CsgD family transcriptional regulator